MFSIQMIVMISASRNPESVWYTDGDVDGFGDGLSEVESCSDVSTVPNSGDCDDSNAEIHPDATEVCDFIDNDCDLLVDNEAPTQMSMVRLPYIWMQMATVLLMNT